MHRRKSIEISERVYHLKQGKFYKTNTKLLKHVKILDKPPPISAYVSTNVNFNLSELLWNDSFYILFRLKQNLAGLYLTTIIILISNIPDIMKNMYAQ